MWVKPHAFVWDWVGNEMKRLGLSPWQHAQLTKLPSNSCDALWRCQYGCRNGANFKSLLYRLTVSKKRDTASDWGWRFIRLRHLCECKFYFSPRVNGSFYKENGCRSGTLIVSLDGCWTRCSWVYPVRWGIGGLIRRPVFWCGDQVDGLIK